MPAYAMAHAAVDVSLSTSVSSAISGSASQQIQQQTSPAEAQRVAAPEQLHTVQGMPVLQPAQDLPEEQKLSQLDNIKWDQVAAWAAGDSAQAAGLVEQLGPAVAESVLSEPDRDHALLRLEAQVARKKLVRRYTEVLASLRFRF